MNTSNQTTLPLVSIIIPVFNGGNFLREAIDSALAQTYRNVEVIVINDGSTDNTEEIALSYGARVRYFRKENGGVSSALNLGIKKMNGEFFSWLSHDDKYFPDKIEMEINALLTHSINPARTVCLCQCVFINGNGDYINLRHKKIGRGSILDFDPSKALQTLIKHGCFNGCALLIPRSAFDEAGFFDIRLRFCQDFLMWIKIFCSDFRLMFIPNRGVMSRVHNNQLTQKNQHLAQSDSLIVCKECVNGVAEKSTRNVNALYAYAKYNAVHNYSGALTITKTIGKEKKLISPLQAQCLKIMAVYGRVRPLIRRLFYRLFWKVKTT